jgi:hypothetical protein
MQPSITNVICIVYEEVKSNMKGVLLYVVHPTDAHLIREDFRVVKQSTYSKGVENQINIDTKTPDKNQLLSPTSQKSNDIYRSSKTRQQSPRRILYVRNNEANTNREATPLSAPAAVPQQIYTPFNNSYHSGREDSGHRRHKSPRKTKAGHSSSKTASDSGSKHRRKHRSRSRSPAKSAKPEVSVDESSPNTTLEILTQQQLQQQLLLQQQQHIAAWQAAQQAPIVPMGIYNR